jgi:putative NADPH-quinone reductase
MDRTVCILQGHPDGKGKHLCHAIADAYADGAKLAGARIRRIDLGGMDIPMLRDPADFGKPPIE